MSETRKVGDVLTSGRLGDYKWWIIDAVKGEWVWLTQLQWSPDLVNERGVMFRTETKIRRKRKSGYLYCKTLGSFDAWTNPVTLKPTP